ncbi:hypothetical protein VroAM7_50800 (plasmid) [Vibrio rotiferianus]|uniref:PRTRC system protein B n=1 Tax=Vibrio rotiferianus TaxID=190895 RepID=A0A510IFW4_9VIBR|nr:hypothetical protein [Vibrio rotiferianus]BBL92427.1 hypothetical protein VroAM7_50800 [Vibrio rotiferianus]
MTNLEFLEPHTSLHDAHIDLTIFEKVETVSALLLHDVKTNQGSQVFMTEHTVREGELGSPKNVSLPSVINHLSSHLNRTERSSSRKIIDGRILYRSSSEILFYTPAKHYTMRFLDNSKKNNSHSVPMPAHVMFYSDGKLRCYAIKSSERPTETTELFISPIPNLYMGNDLCFGTNKPPSMDSNQLVDELIDIAFSSVSNGTHINKPLNDISSFELNRYLINSKHNDSFDHAQLKPLNYTVKYVLENL